MLQEKSYDVIVVGAGFAGSIVAAKVANQGINPSNGELLKIALIEGGPYYKGRPKWGYGHPLRRRMFTHIPHDMRQGDRSGRIVEGWLFHGVGGGSLKWGAKGLPPDDMDYEWWRQETGVDWTKENTKEAVDELLKTWNSHTVPDDLLTEYHFRFKDVVESMGYKTRKMLVHKKNCIMCGTHIEFQPQCRYDAKMSTLLSHIPLAEDRGVEILENTKAEELVIEKRGADWVVTGLWYTPSSEPPQKVSAKRIILACGLYTPLLLYTSGYGPKDLLGDKLLIENPNVGSNIDGHPLAIVEPVTARFENLIVHEPGDANFGFWFLDDKDSRGGERLFICSGADSKGEPGHSGAVSYALSHWAPKFGETHKDWMRKNWEHYWRHLTGTPFYFGPLVAYSHWAGSKARIFPNGNVEFRHMEAPNVRNRVSECRDLIWSIFEEMGAKEIRQVPAWPQSHRFMHRVGACRAGENRTISVVNSNFECHDISNLFIVDATTHPRVSSLWSGGTVVAAMATFAANRIIKNHFSRK